MPEVYLWVCVCAYVYMHWVIFFPEMVNHPPLLHHQVYPHLSRQVGRSIGREYSQGVGTNVMAKDMAKKCLHSC